MLRLNPGDFLVLSLATILGALNLISADISEWAALGLIILAGIPHGAFDLRIAQKKWNKANSLIVPIYLAAGLGMSALCLAKPGLGLIVFFVISIIHFIEGEYVNSTRLGAFSFGTGAILLPIALNIGNALTYLNYFTTSSVKLFLNDYLPPLGLAWIFLLIISLIIDLFSQRKSELFQKLVCLIGWLTLPPLSAFAIWFIGRHSRLHLQGCREFFKKGGGIVPVDFFAISILAIGLITPLFLRFNISKIEELFTATIILIAGLTLPHMLVVRR
jgi:Brp/Blh family beta-carotene 15,15'-monooxygenase